MGKLDVYVPLCHAPSMANAPHMEVLAIDVVSGTESINDGLACACCQCKWFIVGGGGVMSNGAVGRVFCWCGRIHRRCTQGSSEVAKVTTKVCKMPVAVCEGISVLQKES